MGVVHAGPPFSWSRQAPAATGCGVPRRCAGVGAAGTVPVRNSWTLLPSLTVLVPRMSQVLLDLWHFAVCTWRFSGATTVTVTVAGAETWPFVFATVYAKVTTPAAGPAVKAIFPSGAGVAVPLPGGVVT